MKQLKLYEIFLKVAETGSITRTAEIMNYTQSGISHAIANLESSTGFALFTRNVKGVYLTDNGKKMLPLIQNAVNQQKIIEETVFELNNRISGVLRLGSFTSITSNWLPNLIPSFNEEYPDVKIELHDGSYDEIQEWILSGKIDCGFLTSPVDINLEYVTMRKDPLLAVLPVDHLLASDEVVSIEEMLEYPFILQDKGYDSDVLALIKNKDKLKIAYNLRDDIAVVSMIESGLGVGILAELVFKNMNANICTRRLNPEQYREIVLASLPRKQLSIVTRTFIDYVANFIDM